MNMVPEIDDILTERFGHDTLLSVATIYTGVPFVRIVNAYYENGAFYSVTYAVSNKITHIEKNPVVAICGMWFTAHGIGENLGWVREEKNQELMTKLHEIFAQWYNNGHVDENDRNTCILKITLTDAILFDKGEKYEI